MKIRHASDHLLYQQVGGYRRVIERETLARWGVAPKWTTKSGTPSLPAWVCRSDWVVTCDVCREQVAIEPGELFFCPSCLNASHDGYARRVTFPKQKESIERILVLRPDPNTRNWLPGETLKDLEAENAAHGVGV